MTTVRTALVPVLSALLVALAAPTALPGAASPSAIAFDSDRDGNSEIYVMNADGSGQRRITNSPTDDAAPAWSPDGEDLAFASNRDGNWEIYRMEANGSGPARLTDDGRADYDPVWSPDGTQIAFESKRDDNWNVYVMDADGSNERRATSGSVDEFDPVWLSDTQLSYSAPAAGGRSAILVTPTPTTGAGTRTLVVRKTVVNDDGGTAQPSAFTLSVTGGSPSPATFPGSSSGTSVSLAAGSYEVRETAGPGLYATAYSAGCAGAIAAGETRMCTVTNDDTPAKLLVRTLVVNDDGSGDAIPSDFTMTVAGTNPAPSSFGGSSTAVEVSLDPGNYSVDESGPGGYTTVFGAECTGTIAAGQTRTCVVTTDDIAFGRFAGLAGGDFDPATSSDGATASSRLVGRNYDIVLTDPSGAERNLTSSARAEFSPVFTTDGRVLFVAADGADLEIYAVGRDGSGLVNLTDASGALDLNPSWNPVVTGPAPPRVRLVARPAGIVSCIPPRGGVQVVDGAGGNLLVGGRRRDALCGRGGADTLRGKQKGDHLDGGVGADTAQGGGGRDRLLGKDGFTDVLNGGAGNDRATADEDGRDIIVAEVID
jgi:dipeptidyl aminopeptidase/acylaminoacyl peptidase